MATEKGRKSLPKRTGKEQGKRMRTRSHERSKARKEARRKAQDARATANRKAGKPVRARTRGAVLERHQRTWRDAVVFATHNVGGKY